MGLISKRKSEGEPSRHEKIRAGYEQAKASYKKTAGVIRPIAKAEERIMKYATAHPKVKYERKLPWRL